MTGFGTGVRPPAPAPAAPGPMRPALSPAVRPVARPAVLDAARTALIPLRPLSIGEILDGAFLIVRRNARLMVGLPLVVAGGTALYILFGVGIWILLGNTTIDIAQQLVTGLVVLVGVFLLVQCIVWMSALLSRVSLQTVLGEGFAPSSGAMTFRRSLSLFFPMLGLSLLQYVAFSVLQTIISVLYYAFLAGTILAGSDDSVTAVLAGLVSLLTFVLSVLAYGYISLTVPAFSTEGARAPGWIGKPYKPTNVITAFERSVKLIGFKHMVRVALIYCGAVLVSGGLVLLLATGTTVVLVLYASAIRADLGALLTNPWTIFGVLATAMVLAMSGVVSYLSSVQTLLYLDLRMRREGLDMALRFDCVPIPQPAAPPLTFGPPMIYHPPPYGPGPAS